MKRLIILILPLLAMVTESRAQQFRIGIIAGLNICDVDGMNPSGGDDFKKPGLDVGGLVTAHIGPKSFLQMTITYSQQGSQVPPDTTNNNNYYNLSLNYINVALMWKKVVHLSISRKPTDHLGVEAGISGGDLIYSNYSIKSVITPLNLNPFDLTGIVGFFYNFSDNWYFSLTYNNSFTPATKSYNSFNNPYGIFYSTYNTGHNMVFQLTLGFTFGSDKAVAVSTDAPPPPPAGGN